MTLHLKGPNIGISGRVSVEVTKADGTRVEEKCLPEFSNLITEYGLEQFNTTGGLHVYLHVGSGSTSPTRQDTTLESFVTRSPSTVSSSSPMGDVDLRKENNMVKEATFTYVFNLGQFDDVNISEIGLSTSTSNTNMLTRTRLKKEDGSSTSLTIKSDEIITFYYTLRMEISPNQDPYIINMLVDGEPVPITVTPIFMFSNSTKKDFISNHDNTVYRTNIYLGEHTKSTRGLWTHSWNPERTVHTKTITDVFNISEANGSHTYIGIPGASSYSGLSSHATLKWSVSPPIVKNNTQILEISCSHSMTYGEDA